MPSLQSQLLKLRLWFTNSKKHLHRFDLTGMRSSQVTEPTEQLTAPCKCVQLPIEGARAWLLTAASLNPASPVVLYLHGGAYVSGPFAENWKFAAALAQSCHGRVVMLDYPLAPESSQEEMLSACLNTFVFLVQQYGARQVMLCGDSAGGGLALALAMHLRDLALPTPARLALLSPWLDLGLDHPDLHQLAKRDPMLSLRGLQEAAKRYARGANTKQHGYSPLYGDLTDLPPTLLFVGSDELFLPDCLALKQLALGTSMPLEFKLYQGMPHVWPLFTRLPEAKKAISETAVFFEKPFD